MLAWDKESSIRTSFCKKLDADEFLVAMRYPNYSPVNSEITGGYTWGSSDADNLNCCLYNATSKVLKPNF